MTVRRAEPAVQLLPVQLSRPVSGRHQAVLTEQALQFLGALHDAFDGRRRELLDARRIRQAQTNDSRRLDFLPDTVAVREGSWRVRAPPPALSDRRVEITGPPEARMMVHALNSGAKVYMVDFEDALSPTWHNLLEGQANVRDAVRGELHTAGKEGEAMGIDAGAATLVMRPRGLHLDEVRANVGGKAMAASLFDFGLYAFHNAARLLYDGSGPFVYLAKLESHVEARWWSDVFRFTEDRLGLPANCIRPTVLIETLPAAFEMDEILYELRDRSPALNAGRWDYLFSCIKTLRGKAGFVFPDRRDLTMQTPFLWAYAQLLVHTCHRRGAYAIGGMAAFVPTRKDPEGAERAITNVRDDKVREAREGFDGTWVAHPALVPVALEAFNARLRDRTNQVHVHKSDLRLGAAELLYHHLPSASVTEAGLRGNVRVTLAYLASWFAGAGAVAIDNLMEDTATAEISRTQVWQWVQQGVVLEDARTVTADLVRAIAREELQRLRTDGTLQPQALARLDDARALFEEIALSSTFPEFLTWPAMDRLLEMESADALGKGAGA